MSPAIERHLNSRTQRKLESELERLKRLLNLGHGLKVEWLPNDVRGPRGRQLSGEVVGDTIRVYERDEKAAVATLRHEFLDYAISRAIEPYSCLLYTSPSPRD